VSGLAIAAAVLAAVLAVALRHLRRRREDRARPGATADNALPVARFDEIDAAVGVERCRCNGRFRVIGEGSQQRGHVRLRVVQLECDDCGAERRIHFDVTAIFH